MARSLFDSLLGTLDRRSIGEMAGALGESEQAVSRGMESSIAVILAALIGKSQDTSELAKILDLAPAAYGDVTWSRVAAGASDPSSPLVSSGRRVLAALFESEEGAVASAISIRSGLRPGATSTLMGMAARIVMCFVTKRLRDGGLSLSDFAAVLRGESAAVRDALPGGLSDLFWPRTTGAAPAVVGQAAEREKSSSWGLLLTLAALALGLVWIFTHAHRPTTKVDLSGTANRAAAQMYKLGEFVKQTLPNNIDLSIPANGVEARVLAFIQDPRPTPDDKTWFVCDRLQFDTGSANLYAESQEQISNIAAILSAYPSVRMTVVGYTDNVGSPEQNRQLSQARANAVVVELVRKGTSAERLTAEGYGERDPVAGNATEEGRAQNRRVLIRVSQK
jgi:outer membrane protein OmpA-like peptidoglycan-associated protein